MPTSPTLSSLSIKVDGLDTKVEALDVKVVALAGDLRDVKGQIGQLTVHARKADADIAQLQQAVARHDARFDTLDSKLDDGLAKLGEDFAELRVITKGMAGAVMEAISQLAISRAVEKRLDKLEIAVFGSKT